MFKIYNDMFNLNNSHHYDQIDIDFAAIVDYARDVERFLETEYHEHVELRPISPLKIASSDFPEWSNEDRLHYGDHLNHQTIEDFKRTNAQLTDYFPNLQRTTALIAAVAFYELWIRRISLAVFRRLSGENRWLGKPIRSDDGIGTCFKALKRNNFFDSFKEETLKGAWHIKGIRDFFAHQNGVYVSDDVISDEDRAELERAVMRGSVTRCDSVYRLKPVFISEAVDTVRQTVVCFFGSAWDFAKLIDVEYQPQTSTHMSNPFSENQEPEAYREYQKAYQDEINDKDEYPPENAPDSDDEQEQDK